MPFSNSFLRLGKLNDSNSLTSVSLQVLASTDSSNLLRLWIDLSFISMSYIASFLYRFSTCLSMSAMPDLRIIAKAHFSAIELNASCDFWFSISVAVTRKSQLWIAESDGYDSSESFSKQTLAIMNLNLNNSEISRFAEHISAEPSSSWHHIEIYPGKDFLFHHVEHPVWCCLTRVESLVRQVIVLKLDHHQLLVSNEERA